MPTAKRDPLVLVRGEGSRVWDTDGKEYLDFTGGIAVTALGHSHPKVVGTMREQAATLLHVSNLFHIPPADPPRQAARATTRSPTASSSATRARRPTRRRSSSRGSRPRSTGPATAATSSRCGAASTAGRWPPSPPPRRRSTTTASSRCPAGFKYVPFNDLRAVERAIDSRTAAILVEPIQGEGGVNVPDDGYLPGLRKLCDEAGVAAHASTRSRRAWGAPAGSGATSTRASSPTS